MNSLKKNLDVEELWYEEHVEIVTNLSNFEKRIFKLKIIQTLPISWCR